MSLQAATVLANSALEPATMTSVEELTAFFEEFAYSGRHDVDEAELASVLALRPELRDLLTASRDEAVALVNRMLREEQALPQLVRHDEFDWHLHAIATDAPWATRIRV